MADTGKASWITDHPFEPRLDNPYLCAHRPFQPNPMNRDKPRCNMAEAAHRDTTSTEDQATPDSDAIARIGGTNGSTQIPRPSGPSR